MDSDATVPSGRSQSRDHMRALNRQLDIILDGVDPTARFIYIDYPVHDNVGDMLINLGTEMFFARHGVRFWRRFSAYNLPAAIRGVREDDVFVLHGGGNFGDLYVEFQATRERILKEYPHNRVLAMPQTVHFESALAQGRAFAKVGRHQHLRLFARDRASLECLRNGGLSHAELLPDMAHALIDVLKPPATTVAHQQPLRLLRRDRESQSGMVDPESTDWHQFIPRPRRAVHRILTRTIWEGQRRYGITLDLHRPWYWHRRYLVDSAVALFGSYESVVTDRLHGMLLALLLDKRVVARDNSYGKLSNYYDTWLSDNPLVRLEVRYAPVGITSSAGDAHH